MNTHPRTVRRIAASAALTAALSAAAVAGPAQAATNPYTPQGVCGAGFGVIDQQALRSGTVQLGTVYLLYQASSGRNCVVTMKERAIGKKTLAGVFLQKKNGRGDGKSDLRRYKFYAGPRKVTAKGTCVKWGGSVTAAGRHAAYLSDYEHCA